MQRIIIYWLCGLFAVCKASFDCNSYIHDACKPQGAARYFPENEKEFEIFCKDGETYIECSVNFENTCQKNVVPLERANKLLQFLKGICSKNHPLYSAIVFNLKCAKPIINGSYFMCDEKFPSEESFKKYSKALLDKGIEPFPGNDTANINCLKDLYYTACEAKEMEKCGKTAVETFVKLSGELDTIMPDKCGENIGTNLPDILHIINSMGQ